MHKTALGWTIADIKGITLLICTHRIYLEENAKPSREMQRRLNPNMKEVVRTEVIKILDNGISYPISDSKWVSPTQVIPKKSGVTVITDTTKRLMSSPKCRSVEVINNPVRPGSNHREVNCINYR